MVYDIDESSAIDLERQYGIIENDIPIAAAAACFGALSANTPNITTIIPPIIDPIIVSIQHNSFMSAPFHLILSLVAY